MQQKNLCLASAATLMACRSIAQAFAENIFELSHLRASWSVDYAKNLKKRIQEVMDKHFSEEGHLHSEKIRDWREMIISALTDLALVRASVRVDFKEDPAFIKEVFDKLGYTDYFSDAKNGDHVSMFNFIREFAANLTPSLQGRITEKGLDPHILERLIEDAKMLEKFHECFEIVSDASLIEDEGKKSLEAIYDEIQDICRITGAYYFFDPVRKESFNFFKALRKVPV